MSRTTLLIKAHETEWQVWGLIICCAPHTDCLGSRKEATQEQGWRGWRKDPGRGWRFRRSGGRWMKMNARGTQRPWWMIPMSSGTIGIDTTFCPTFLGQQCSPCGKGKSRSSGTTLGEPVRLRQSSRAKAWILLVLRQILLFRSTISCCLLCLACDRPAEHTWRAHSWQSASSFQCNILSN